ncbi:hypothetical protein GWK47_036129 [Chionoecetes opilio]|uniref:Uncharacterized protein n=1 Tax=Chionoecetes opilio TaxID=41210 RepID=A0A8J4YEP3_CHIOP|nr:hypothetical protein GWK47_036129 [Chionoecetes opilio]
MAELGSGPISGALKDRSSCWGQPLPGGPRGIMQGSNPILGPTESDGSARACESGRLTERASRLPRAAHRAWVAGRPNKRTVVTTDGTRTSFRALGIIRSIGCSPKLGRTTHHDAGCRRCVGPHKDLGQRPQFIFSTAVHGADATPARSTVRRHRRARGRRWLKEIRRR